MSESHRNKSQEKNHNSKVASELNNLIQIISGTSSLIENIWEGRPGSEKYFEMLRASIERAEQVTAQLVAQAGGTNRKRLLPSDFEQRFNEALIAGAPNQHKHSILVVDDEPMALELLHGVLSDAGYKVAVAQSGFECLDLFRRDTHAFDLILTDLSMPLMDGEETFERLRQMSPTVNVVLMAGFVDSGCHVGHISSRTVQGRHERYRRCCLKKPMTSAPAKAFAQLCQNRLFEGIGAKVLERIRPDVNILQLKRGDVVFKEGDLGDSLYLVGEGSIKISKQGRGGRQEVLDYIQTGNFFGEVALLGGQPHSAMASAAEPTVLGAVKEETFQHILELAPSRLHMNFLRLITERMRSVNSHFITEIMRSERLSLVGSMANSIIHDLKNPICIVRCCSDLIASETNDSRLRELTSMLDGTVDGMLAMTQELLDYARGSTQLNKQLISVWGMLDELNQQSLRLLPGKNIHFVKHIRYDGNLEIDRARFVRMLSSLIKNSREAMVGGGILTITTDLVQDQVVLRISDTGVGIPPEILPRLFEPFMTHGKSSGTGLGLAIGRSVVEAHGGKISLSSVYGSGTTIDIRLPKPRE